MNKDTDWKRHSEYHLSQERKGDVKKKPDYIFRGVTCICIAIVSYVIFRYLYLNVSGSTLMLITGVGVPSILGTLGIAFIKYELHYNR